MRTRNPNGVRCGNDRESGQAMVEFALILFPLLTLVAGIIYFGIGLNYWLDMNRIANQGARWAVVNNWPPECPHGHDVHADAGMQRCARTVKLQDTLKCMAITKGLQDGVTVDICYPAGNNEAGSPVRVRLRQPYKFFFMDTIGITLTANATMRLEQPATRSKIAADNAGVCT